MPLLSYSYADFTPNTVIQSAQVNAKFNDIKTLLNTTKLDDTNIQNAGLTRATKLKTGTANYVLINDGTGAMSEEAALSPTRGGLGTSLTLTGADTGKPLVVNGSGTGFDATNAPETVSGKLYMYNRSI